MGDTMATGINDACVIIPMYNEASVIGEVVRAVRGTFAHVVCVDDGSADDSARIAHSAGAMVVSHLSNLGQGAALQTGLTHALSTTPAQWFITYDADGQHRLEDAERMLTRARTCNADLVLGSRFLGEAEGIPFSRRLLLFAGVRFTRLTTSLRVTDTHNGLRVLNRRAAQLIRIRISGMAHASELLEQVSRLGLNYEEYPVTVRYTDYSTHKGQRSLNAINILFDLLMNRVRADA